jgi:hypothetical protein
MESRPSVSSVMWGARHASQGLPKAGPQVGSSIIDCPYQGMFKDVREHYNVMLGQQMNGNYSE